nr:PREDICTED: protein DEK isoform X3 [Latimeria chalumnae]|eukprot:XP_006008098.1 PREDICTED: protein DEK isoform X3 [Latimeria chalumnae]
MSSDVDSKMNVEAQEETEEVNLSQDAKEEKLEKGKAEESEEGEGEDDDDDEEYDDDDDEKKEKSLIVEGKREKKKVERLSFQVTPPKKEPFALGEGKGEKLGDIERIKYFLGRMQADELKPLHKLLFNRPGVISSVKRNIRLFSGFPFEKGSDHYKKKEEMLKKYKKVSLKMICGALDLEKSGDNSELVARILNFLMKPKSTGQGLPKSKSKSKSKRKTSKGGKRESSGSGSARKSKASKSEEILSDWSSSEEEKKKKDESSEEGDKGSDEEEEEEEKYKANRQKGVKRKRDSSVSKGKPKQVGSNKAGGDAERVKGQEEVSEHEEKTENETEETPKKTAKKEKPAPKATPKSKKQATKPSSVKKADSSTTKKSQSSVKKRE